jgi:hypothetical protein
MSDEKRYRVWCLSWDEAEEDGRDVVRHDHAGEAPNGVIAVAYLDVDSEAAAELYAEYVHDNCDGYESTWPLKFRVRKPDGTTEDFEVEREYDPTFTARKT